MVSVSLIIILLLVAVDQLLKIVMNLWLLSMPQCEYVLSDGVFSFAYVTNKGAAWGMFAGNRFILIGVTLVAMIVIAVFMYRGKIKGVCYNVAAVMILAGGIGNLIDRVFRGYVIDYLRVLFIDFPVFNFADCLITVGAVFLFVKLIIEIYYDWKDDKNKRALAEESLSDNEASSEYGESDKSE